MYKQTPAHTRTLRSCSTRAKTRTTRAYTSHAHRTEASKMHSKPKRQPFLPVLLSSLLSFSLVPSPPRNDALQLLTLSALGNHTPEHAVGAGIQVGGGAELDDLALAQDEDLVKVGDGAEAVRDDEQRAVVELLADRPLDQRVGRHVDRAGRLVQHHDFRPRDDRACEAEELPLALGQVEPAFGDGGGEGRERVFVEVLVRFGGGRCGPRAVDGGRGAGCAVGGADGLALGLGDQVYTLQRVAEFGVLVIVKSVEVATDSAGEEYGVLRDDG